MAQLSVRIEDSSIVRKVIQQEIGTYTFLILAYFLKADPDVALDWFIAKASAFRGISENDMRDEIVNFDITSL